MPEERSEGTVISKITYVVVVVSQYHWMLTERHQSTPVEQF